MEKLFTRIAVFSFGIILLIAFSCNGQNKPLQDSTVTYVSKLDSNLVADTVKAKPGDPIFIRIIKDENLLEIWVNQDNQYKLLKNFPICYYSGGLGPKYKQGDGKSPEGFYFINKSRLNPHSSYHLSMNTGYPNKYDRAHGYTGDYLMIHGDCVSIGCYAMTDKGIEEIYNWVEKALSNGQSIVRVHIFPFRMTKEKLDQHKTSKYYSFWENLKPGYDYFEKHNKPPNVEVVNKKYVFE